MTTLDHNASARGRRAPDQPNLDETSAFRLVDEAKGDLDPVHFTFKLYEAAEIGDEDFFAQLA